jgi:hypothetical protein
LFLSLAVPCNWDVRERAMYSYNELAVRVLRTAGCEQLLKGLSTYLSQRSACLMCGVPECPLSYDCIELIHSAYLCIQCILKCKVT